MSRILLLFIVLTFLIIAAEPDITRVEVSISGTLSASASRLYGPYSSVTAVTISLDFKGGELCAGYVYADDFKGKYSCSTSGRLYVSYSVDWTRDIYILVYNPSSSSVSYSGTATLYIW